MGVHSGRSSPLIPVQTGPSSHQTLVEPRGGALLTSDLGCVRKASETSSSEDQDSNGIAHQLVEFAGGQFSGESSPNSPRKPSEADSDLQEQDHSITEDSCYTPTSGNLTTPPMGCVTETLIPATTRTSHTGNPLDTNLLQDAILDQSPNAKDSLLSLTRRAKSMTSSTPSVGLPLNLGVDGLPHVNDAVHLKLREVDTRYKLKLSELQSQLDEARRAVHAHAQQTKLEVDREGRRGSEEGAGSQKEEASTPEEQV